jgi:hypothetical protein
MNYARIPALAVPRLMRAGYGYAQPLVYQDDNMLSGYGFACPADWFTQL